MAGARGARRVQPAAGARLLLVEADYHAAVTALLRAGAEAVLREAGAAFEHVAVPGALEIPPAVAIAHAAGAFDGFVALGCVIRGETIHFDLVAGESGRGLTELGIRGVAIGNGILTVDNEDQALERARPERGDKGGDAAAAALSLVALRRRLGGRPA